jgi:hypothetical protein
MTRKVWLGNNVATTLTVDNRTIEPGGTITLTAGQEAYLTRRGHRFAEPGSAEARATEAAQDTPGAGLPPIPAEATAAGQPANTGRK